MGLLTDIIKEGVTGAAFGLAWAVWFLITLYAAIWGAAWLVGGGTFVPLGVALVVTAVGIYAGVRVIGSPLAYIRNTHRRSVTRAVERYQ